jgi:hypothetical protein
MSDVTHIFRAAAIRTYDLADEMIKRRSAS